MIEKRFEQIKTVHEIAPVFLKDEGRIEALFTLYAIALLVQALIERELRQAMARQGIDELPIYPEQRQCEHPTTEPSATTSNGPWTRRPSPMTNAATVSTR